MKSSIIWDVTWDRALFFACFMLVSCSSYSSTLKMEVTCFSKLLIDFQWTACHCMPEDRTFNIWDYMHVFHNKILVIRLFLLLCTKQFCLLFHRLELFTVYVLFIICWMDVSRRDFVCISVSLRKFFVTMSRPYVCRTLHGKNLQLVRSWISCPWMLKGSWTSLHIWIWFGRPHCKLV